MSIREAVVLVREAELALSEACMVLCSQFLRHHFGRFGRLLHAEHAEFAFSIRRLPMLVIIHQAATDGLVHELGILGLEFDFFVSVQHLLILTLLAIILCNGRISLRHSLIIIILAF